MWAADPGEKTNRNGRTVSQIGRALAARRRGARGKGGRGLRSVAICVNRALGPARSFGAARDGRGSDASAMLVQDVAVRAEKASKSNPSYPKKSLARGS